MPKMKEQAVYQITVTERQLKLINAALEEFFRIGLNQWGDLAERVANIGFEYPPKDMPNRELVFDRHIHTRDTVRTVLEAAGRILWPYGLDKQNEDNLLAQDICRFFGISYGWTDRIGTNSATVWTVTSLSSNPMNPPQSASWSAQLKR